MSINPRSITDDERPWIEHWSPDAHRVLLDAVRQRDTTRVALNVCSYVAARALGEPSDIVAPQARTQYRRILAELADDGITPPGARSLVSVTGSTYAGPKGRPVESAGAAPVAPSAPAARRRGAAASADPKRSPRMYVSDAVSPMSFDDLPVAA